jgi:membrane dipeptidase
MSKTTTKTRTQPHAPPATKPLPIFDGHNDVLLSLYLPERGKGRSFFKRSAKGHIDLPRAHEGGFAGGMFAVFIPNERSEEDKKKKHDPDEGLVKTPDGYEFPLPPALELGYAQRMAFAVSARLFRLEAESNGQLKVVRTADELERCLRDGVIAAVLHFEGAEAIDPDLNALYVFHRAGLRSLGPVWSRPTIFAHGVPFKFPHSPDTGPGLTDAGRALVRACNELGIMLDVSHLNEKGFWDLAALTNAPIVASHSCVHAISACTRNLTDKQLDAIGESNGLVGINYNVGFARPDGQPNADMPLSVLADHVAYVAERIGVEHVALGSDFDGAQMPNELKDAAGLPKLVDTLRARGFDGAALRQIAHENWVRVLRATWK